MIRVSIEVRNNEVSRFTVAVLAESIRRAMSLVGERYPEVDVEVEFPIDPESFFVEDPAAGAGLVESEQPETMAA